LVIAADVSFDIEVRVACSEGVSHLEAGGDLDPKEEFCRRLGWDREAITLRVWGNVEVTKDIYGASLGACSVDLGYQLVEPVMVSG
jgi:hypothetical protein